MRVAREIGHEVPQRAIDDHGRDTLLDLREAAFELAQPHVAFFIDARRLRGGPNEHAREQIRERRVVLPIRDQRAQQIRPA
jgi:hypothetical protein